MLVVGAGFCGSVVARRLADAGRTITVIDKRPHIGGNAYDELDLHGVLVHKYGPHAFHTNSLRIKEYLSNFTDWYPYEYRVRAMINGRLVPIPINRTTINTLYSFGFDQGRCAKFFEMIGENRPVVTSEDVVLNAVGHRLCDLFFRGYTRKQWGLDLSELAPSVAARIPTRSNDDDRYNSDTYQCMPLRGYTQMFHRMLTHKRIKLYLGEPYEKFFKKQKIKHTIWTGPIDEFFDYRHGRLPYRSLRFEHWHEPKKDYLQPVATINHPLESTPYTRIVEFKHMTGQKCKGTSLCREFPMADGDPFYPIPRFENALLYEKYKELATTRKDVTFVGRLAQYRYYNMDQAVGAALAAADKILGIKVVKDDQPG